MPTIHIPIDMARRLEHLARITGRSRDAHAQEAILEYLDSAEDLQLSERRLAVIRAHKLKTVPIRDVLERYRLKKEPFSD